MIEWVANVRAILYNPGTNTERSTLAKINKPVNGRGWSLNTSLPNFKINRLFKSHFWSCNSECFYLEPPPRRCWWQRQLRHRKRRESRVMTHCTNHSQSNAEFREFSSKAREQGNISNFPPS